MLMLLLDLLSSPLLPSQSGISYKWSDGSETVYTHWDAEDDDEDSLTEDCVYVDVNGRWRRADCETLLPGALCQEPHPSQFFARETSKSLTSRVVMMYFCSVSQAVNTLSPMKWCVPPRGSNLDKVVTVSSLWFTSSHLKSQESTAG